MPGPGLGHKLHGKNGAIYFNGPIGVGVKVTTKTEWTLNLNRDYVDATVFGDTNKTYLVGLKDIQGTFAGLLDVSGDYQVNASNSDDINIYLYADDGTNGGDILLVASGPGLVDAAITASNTDAIKTTGNFRAAGAWTVFTTGI
jgi:hypothetical protein